MENSLVRKRLLKLQKEGFLFHGSPYKVSVLKPNQPVNFDIKKGKNILHGKLSVAATPYADIAIFRAVVNKKNFPLQNKGYASQFGLDKDTKKLYLATTSRVLDSMSKQKGYVYIFSKNQFSKHSLWEWRSPEKVKPLKVVRVGVSDLNKSIIRTITYDFKKEGK